MRQRGGAFKGEIEEKRLDGKDRQWEGYRQVIKKPSESSTDSVRQQTKRKPLDINASSTRLGISTELTEGYRIKGGIRETMDVQTENTDPPPNEPQPSGKIRKGFKLFGKRKPGNIFSIRSKGDGNNKSPVISSKTLDGSSESPAPNSEADKENGQEAGQGEREQPEDETLGEDGVLASAPARTSISSASSAKSLSFLSLLRGGRRGTGDRRVHTVSQPVGRQRRGLKGLFGNVKFRSKDKEDKEETPPSPLLMSSRANSVEIIKEDLTLTPKCQPRSLDSPETESCDPVHSSSTSNSAAMSPSSAHKETTENVSRTNMAPSPTSEPPLIPGDNSLSSLLADISSLLTFDSISGGDIMADVEAEWGKASSALSTEVTPSSFFSKSTISPPTFSTFSSAPTVKPSSVAFSSSATTKPDTLTTFTKSSTLTSHSVKLSSDSTPAFYSSTSIQNTTKPSTIPATSATFSASATPATSTTVQSTSCFTSITTTPANTQTTLNKTPPVCPSKLDAEITSPSPRSAPVSKPNPISVSPAVSAKSPVATQSSPFPVTQPPPVKPDVVRVSSLEKSNFSKTAAEFRSPETVTTCVVTTKPISPSLVTSFKTTTVPTTTMTSGYVSTALSKPPVTSAHLDLNKTHSSSVSVSDPGPSSTFTATTKTQPSPASAPAPSSTLIDKIPPMTKPTTAVPSDKMPPPYTPTPAASTHAASTASPIPAAMGQIKISASGVSPAQLQISVSKELPAAAQMEDSQPKVSPTPAQVPVSVSKDPSALVKMPISSSKAPSYPAETPLSVSKAPLVSAQIPVTVSIDSRAPISVPVSASKAPPQIPISQPKTQTAATAPCPATSLHSPPAPWPSETSAKMRGAGHVSNDHQVASPDGTGGQGSQAVPPKTKELHNESQMSLQGLSKEKKPTQSKASGLSKIPVVGGGKVGKLPVRESQHSSDEANRDPPTPTQEEGPNFNSHDGNKDKITASQANAPTSKHIQEESQQLQQSKGFTSSTRDSKIPVKHGTQTQTASQIPHTKEPPRTKIPVSKVPVRRAGNKPAATGGNSQIRK